MPIEVLEAKGLTKVFELRQRDKTSLSKSVFAKLGLTKSDIETFYALKDVSFSLNKGEMLGVIGKNGSGKSTLLKILSEIIYPTNGEVTYTGRLTSILDIGSGFHPELSGRDNAIMYASLLGLDKNDVFEGMDEIIEFSEIGEFIDQSVKYYSNGMYLRLAFAVALYCNVDILVLDEILSVGDSAFMIKSHERIQKILEKGTAIILASHSLSDVLRTCNRCIWLKDGEIAKIGPTPEVVAAYLQSNLWTSRSSQFISQTDLHSNDNMMWKIAEYPKNDYVRLLEVSIRSNGRTTDDNLIDYNDPIEINIVYDRLTESGQIDCLIIIVDQFNAAVAVSTPPFAGDAKIELDGGQGTFSNTCIIPGQLLNLGVYKIYLRVMYEGKEIMEVPDVAIFRIESNNKLQEVLLEKTPLSVCASFDWHMKKLN